jgi:hypothetical protein
MLSVTPFRISTGIVFIRSGVFSATFSISVPPADEAIITGPLKPLIQKGRVTDYSVEFNSIQFNPFHPDMNKQ